MYTLPASDAYPFVAGKRGRVVFVLLTMSLGVILA
jgi:hypothetical protein